MTQARKRIKDLTFRAYNTSFQTCIEIVPADKLQKHNKICTVTVIKMKKKKKDQIINYSGIIPLN